MLRVRVRVRVRFGVRFGLGLGLVLGLLSVKARVRVLAVLFRCGVLKF